MIKSFFSRIHALIYYGLCSGISAAFVYYIIISALCLILGTFLGFHLRASL